MSEPLTPLADLPRADRENLLLGNGFSLAFSQAFDYKSLFEKAIELRIVRSPLDGVFSAFAEVDAYDFEGALARLWTAGQVATILEQDPKPYSGAHSEVREALLSSIRAVHPKHSDIGSERLKKVGERLSSSYKKIFTTSYDLLLYWCMGARDFHPFADFFWNEGGSFDPASKERDDQVPVFFLHGALHLYSRDNVVGKLAGDGVANILEQVDVRWQQGDIPHFVSEGHAKQKIAAIQRSPYLSGGAHRFSTISGSLTVFGSRLGESDKHLANWICDNGCLSRVVISVHGSPAGQQSSILQFRKMLPRFTQNDGKLFFVSSCELAEYLGLVDP